MAESTITILITCFAALFFVTEWIPLGVTAMFSALALYFTGVIEAKDVFSNLTNNNVMIFIGMFIIGGCLFKTGIAETIGSKVARYAKTERQLMISVMVLTMLLSSVLSNVGTVAVLMPIVISIADTSGFPRSKLLMSLSIAAILGGNITLIGSIPPGVAKGVLENAYPDMTFTFGEFAYIGIPLCIVGLLYMLLIGGRLIPDTSERLAAAGDTYKSESRDYSHIKPWERTITMIVMIVVIVCMVLEKVIGVPLHISAMTGAFILITTRVVAIKQAAEMVEWNTVLITAGMLTVAGALNTSGAGELIAGKIIGLIGESTSPLVLFSIFFITTAVLTQFMSNVTTTSLLAPIGMAMAPKAVLVAIVIGASCAFGTPIGSPPSTIVVGPGGFKFTDFTKVGVPLIVLCFIVSLIIVPIVWPF